MSAQTTILTRQVLAAMGRRSTVTGSSSSRLVLQRKAVGMTPRTATTLCEGSWSGNSASSGCSNRLRVQGNLPHNIHHSQRIFFSSYPAHQVVGLPSLSPTMDSGSISNWNVKAGDSFAPGESLCSVETDKATVDFEAQDEGVVAKILIPAGSGDIKVGTPIMVICDNVSDVAAFADFSLGGEAPAAAPATPKPAAAAPAAATPSSPPAAPQTAPSASSTGGRVIASPLAYTLAKELGYDIRSIPGTGPGGRVIAADVKEFVPAAAAAAPLKLQDVVELDQQQQQHQPPAAASKAAPAKPAPTPAAPPVAGAGYTDYPLSESAKEVAARLVQSKRNVPHYYLTVDVTMDALLELRSNLNASLNKNSKGKDATSSPSLGVYEMVLKAAAAAMKTVPSANASWMDSVVRVYDSVDINVVLGSGDSLYTPVIRNVASKGLLGLSQELTAAVSMLDGGSNSSSSVGTFTVVNLGMYGIKSCAPIIREPQACALAMGALENRIVPNDDTSDGAEIYKQSVVMTVTLSCDHRVVDGAVGAQWLAAFKSHVENPATLLL